MAAPNVVNVSTITAKSTGLLATTSAVALLSNAASSGKVLKINTLLFSNIAGSSASATVYVIKNATTTVYLAYGIACPATSSLVVLSKDTSIYLEENDVLYILASAISSLHAFCSYEEIS